MEVNVDVDISHLQTCLCNNEWSPIVEVLDKTFKITIDKMNGKPLPFAYSSEVKEFLVNAVCKLTTTLKESKHNCFDTVMSDACLSVFKAIRNYALNEKFQTALVNDENFVDDCGFLLKKFTSSDMCNIPTAKLILQSLSNCTIHANDRKFILERLGSILICCLQHTELSYITSALFYNVMKNTDGNVKYVDENIYDVFLEEYEKQHDNEYLTFIVEILLQTKEFYSNYKAFKITHRLIILDVVSENIHKDNFLLPAEFVTIITQVFKDTSDCILKAGDQDIENIDPVEACKLLSVLSSLSGIEKYLQNLQNDKSLLVTCSYLLKSIHLSGKNTKNNFTAIQRLSELTSPADDIKHHPAFGIKADLIRLLGNMSWKNKNNQDELREIEIIPVILDCCNMDARNPFIMQWCILAIKNLCDGNPANQSIIGSLTKQGVVDSSFLQELGLTLHADGNSEISVVPLDSFKKIANVECIFII